MNAVPENPVVKLSKGSYVLATKYCDGDAGDQWCIGFYDRNEGGRHYVVNGEGMQFRANGFRRVKEISYPRGAWILSKSQEITASQRSLWNWVRSPMHSRAQR